MNNNEVATHTVGEVLNLGIRVENSLSWPLVDIMLQLYLFQDYQNGVINQQLDGCLSTIGATEVNLEKVNISAFDKCSHFGENFLSFHDAL